MHFEDGALTTAISDRSFTVTRFFPAPGTYRYYCQLHNGDGGVGMSGVVYVIAAGVPPPVAAFTVVPNPARVGQNVSFDAANSSASDGSIVKYVGALDGNGSFETDTGTTPTASRSYATPAMLGVRLRVTDGRAETAEATRALTVKAPNVAPIAAFTISPNPAQTGQSVRFDPAASHDPYGTIRKYEWDLDGDGLLETVSFGAPLIGLKSVSKVKIGLTKQLVKIADKTFKASAAGNVNAALKLSNKNLAALKKARRMSFVVAVKTFTAKLTSKAPKKR